MPRVAVLRRSLQPGKQGAGTEEGYFQSILPHSFLFLNYFILRERVSLPAPCVFPPRCLWEVPYSLSSALKSGKQPGRD